MTRRVIPALLVMTGLAILVTVAGPIGWHQMAYLLKPKLIDPTDVSGATVVLAASVLGGGIDYTNSTAWFPEAQVRPPSASKVHFYNLSIPSVGIENIAVEIDGQDLKKNAIQYTGTAIPGEWGNTVIFGHSTLPQLYKSGSPISVFNFLPKIAKGADIIINQ